VDISALQPGERMIVEWRGKPVWMFKRTPEMLATLKTTDSEVADPCPSAPTFPRPSGRKTRTARESHKDILVVVGICTHLGCSPVEKFKAGPQPSLPDNWGRLLPLPRLDLRFLGARVQEQAGAVQPGGAAAHVPVGHQAADRRRQESIRGGHG
jgi:Rieske Fe-S protein